MPDPDQLVGTTIGNGQYKIERKLGQGGMAQVYLAQDTRLSRKVAIKVLDKNRAADSRFIARFEREARIAPQLKHTNIVSVFDVAKTDGLFYIVMEYLEGKTLEAILREFHQAGRTMDAAFTLLIFQQIANGLLYAYETQRVVHRDIKPANIMVSPKRHVKITDFGIARALEEDSDLTSDNSYIGTPFYMSPEHFKGGTIDHRSDIYSLGIVLYQMVVDGSGPFGKTATTFTALMNKHVNEPPIAPRLLKPDISPHVEAVILKALEKDPNQRFQTSLEMAQALDRAYNQPATIAPPPATASKKLPRWLVASGIGVLILVLLAGLAGTGGFLLYRNMSSTGDSSTPGPIASGSNTPDPTIIAAPPSPETVEPAGSLETTLLADTQLRTGPGHEYDESANLTTSDAIQIDSISPDDKWVKVSVSSGQTGWVSIASVDMDNIDIMAISLALIIPPSPTPNSTAPPTVQTEDQTKAFTPTAEPANNAATSTSTATPASSRPTVTPAPTVTLSPTQSTSNGQPSRPKVAQPAQVVYIQSDRNSHYLGLVSSSGELLNGYLHQYAAAPTWGPNGVQLAFYGEPGISQLDGVYSKDSGIWILDTKDPIQNPAWQLKAEERIQNMVWSADGSKIAYEILPPNANATIVVIDAANGQELHRFPGEQPAWSPDGQQLVIKACIAACGLWLVNFDGAVDQQLTFEGSDSYPNWSSTGQLAFSSNRDNNWEIYSLDIASQKLTRVTNRLATDVTPVYSREGAEIYLRTDNFGGWRVTAMKADGSDERTVKEGVGESTNWGLARPVVY